MKTEDALHFLTSNERHEAFMYHALELAEKAYELKEIPVGALIVDEQGAIIGKGYNTVETDHCSLRHAEIKALEQAMQIKGDWRLTGCVMYVTLEPCVMCYGALNLSRIDHVFYGAASPLYGFTKEIDLFMSASRYKTLYTPGILESECALLLNTFFKSERL